MPNEHFCLKWNNFQRNIVAALGNLKLDEDFVDVTISCEGGKLIKAHKVILSACSDYFRDLFRVRHSKDFFLRSEVISVSIDFRKLIDFLHAPNFLFKLQTTVNLVI